MNPEGVEREKRKNGWRDKIALSHFIFLLPVCACITIGYIFPILNVVFHHLQWELSKPASYTATLSSVGLCGSPPMTVDEMDNNVANIDPISRMFQEAYACEILPKTIICHVEFDGVYGYPTSVGGMFIEGCWTEMRDFQVLEEQREAEK